MYDSFRQWLLSVGGGIFANNSDEQCKLIKIPQHVLCEDDFHLRLPADLQLPTLTQWRGTYVLQRRFISELKLD